MFRIIFTTTVGTFNKNIVENLNSFPLHFFIGRMLSGLYSGLFGYFIFYYVFNEQISLGYLEYSSGIDFLTFYFSGVIVLVICISSIMNISRSIMMELWQGTLVSFYSSPCSIFGYYSGVTLEQMVRSFLESFPTLLLAIFLGANFIVHDISSYLIAYLLLIFVLFNMSMFVSAIMLYSKDTYLTQNTVFYVMSLLCGFTFPIEYLPKVLSYISMEFIPLTEVLYIVRFIIQGNSIFDVSVESFYKIFILCLIYYSFGMIILKFKSRELLEKIRV